MQDDVDTNHAPDGRVAGVSAAVRMAAVHESILASNGHEGVASVAASIAQSEGE